MPLIRRRIQPVPDSHDVDPEDFPEVGYSTPPTEELMGDYEPDVPAVRVTLDGEEVCVAPEPARILSVRTHSVPTGESVKVLPDDVRRDTATIVTLDNDMLLGVNRGDATAQWPVGVPLVTRATGELWARAVGATTLVTVVVEQRAR